MFNRAPGIGLDIGSKKIKLAQVKSKKQGLEVVNFGSMATPDGIVEGGVIQDPDRLGEELGVLVRDMKLNGKNAVSAVSGQQVYTRNISMPAMPLKELKDAIQFQAMNFLPIPVEEAVMDIFPIRDYEDEEGKKTEVFFVAVRRQQVETLDLACKVAGLNLVAVEIEPIAINRLLDPMQDEENKAYLNIGASRSYFTVFRNGVMTFYRSLSFGCAAFFQSSDLNGNQSDNMRMVSIRDNDTYDYLVRDVISEMARSVEYYDMQNQGAEVKKIYLMGGGSRIQQLAEILSEGIAREVVVADLLSGIRIPKDISEEEYDDLQHDFSVAIGLAARKSL
ncbi:MAG: type IV pilus assembly protein PilM [Bacillota bacterium]|nr:type IV pilus assembly protein PilM [Bacillota bacterium]